MINIEEFYRQAGEQKLRITEKSDSDAQPTLLSNEALFHLPLLAMAILTLSKGRRKPSSSEIGQIIGECLERTLAGFKGSAQHIGWSANLRIRTTTALTFLEAAKLVVVDEHTSDICATDLGRSVLKSATAGQGNLATTLAEIERSYRNISVERQLALELT